MKEENIVGISVTGSYATTQQDIIHFLKETLLTFLKVDHRGHFVVEKFEMFGKKQIIHYESATILISKKYIFIACRHADGRG